MAMINTRTLFAAAIALLGVLHVHARPVVAQTTGIKVHGDWTIEVRRPDNTIVTRREFRNALETQGGRHLASLLARSTENGSWYWLVTLEMPGGLPPCNQGCITGETVPAAFLTSQAQQAGLNIVIPGNLSVSTSDAKVVLVGSFTAEHDGDISKVSTVLMRCSSGGSCDSASLAPFSSTTLDAIRVTAGQIVQVKVTVSFS
jgi:hypothetical protein